LKLQIIDKNYAILDNQHPAAKGGGWIFVSFGMFLIILGVWAIFGLYIEGEYVIIIFGISTVFIGFICIRYYSYLEIDKISNKVYRYTIILGLYKWQRKAWDLDKIDKAEGDPDYFAGLLNRDLFNLKFISGETETALRLPLSTEAENYAKHFNLFIKGKYTTPGTINYFSSRLTKNPLKRREKVDPNSKVSSMIEVISYMWKKQGKFSGYIDGKKYLNKKQILQSFIEGNKCIDKKGYTLLILREDNVITYNDGEEVGCLKENKIFGKEYYDYDFKSKRKKLMPEYLICEFIKDKGIILDSKGSILLELKGNFDHLTNVDYFGIANEWIQIFS